MLLVRATPRWQDRTARRRVMPLAFWPGPAGGVADGDDAVDGVGTDARTLPRMSLAWRRGADRSWRMLVALCVLEPLACGDDTSVDADDSSSSADDSGSASADETSPGEEATSNASAEEGTGAATTGVDSTGADPGTTSGSSDDAGSTSVAEESSSSRGDEESSNESGEQLMCPAGTLGPGLPDSLFGNTFAELDDFSGSCGGAGAPDLGYTFTAPADGFYTFDTHGSQLDTVIYVLDGECAGTEIACNDNGDLSQSAVSVDLTAGQTVTIVVDGNDVGGLPFTLRAQAGSLVCPVADLGNAVPNTIAGDTTELFAGTAGTCGGQAGREAAYLFTAPSTGTFTFDTFGSSFESILYVLDGTCSGNQLACGDEGILVDLVAGQEVTVVVDSQFPWGAFDLNVNGLGGACPDVDLGNTVPQTVMGDTSDGDNTDAGSCGGDFSFDDLYEFTAPQAGLYEFNTFGSALDTVLYLVDGCGGTELDCNDDLTAVNDESRVIEGLDAGQTVIIGVDGNGVGAYQLEVDIVPCPNETAPNTVPQTLNDTTNGGIDKLKPSCGDSGPLDESPDYAYAFTAPTDGVYTFDTFGTAFDTVLYVVEGGACNGAEIACNDDYQFGVTSALAVTLTAGQTVSVVVDGDFLAQGAFTLNIGELGGTCPDEDLANVIPSVVMGSLAAEDDAGFGSCGGLASNDYSYTFTAPIAAPYMFEVVGAANDAIVYVTDSCGGQEIACDLANFNGQALIVEELLADQTVVVTVDGSGLADDFTLTIDEAPPGGDCCEPHPDVGCSVQEIEDCVCAIDAFCCNNSWDQICANEAVDDCGALCA